jgi:hypothetical protein
MLGIVAFGLAWVNILFAFAWLLLETDFLQIRLLAGPEPVKKFAQYKAFTGMGKRKNYDVQIRHGANYPLEQVHPGPVYDIVFNPGITDPLCGWEWVDKHVADLVGFETKVDLQIGTVKYKMIIRKPGIFAEVMKANKGIAKQERLNVAV